MTIGVKVEAIEKQFGGNHVLKGINLEVHEGELVSILGSSGCGKTTLLRIIAGLEEASSGYVFFGDDLQNNINVEKRSIAMVFQKALLFPNMTIGENVAFSLKANGEEPKSIQKRVNEMLELVRLPGFENRRPGELSGGQEQRVSLARALIRNPKVLLLDEPLSALDANLRVEMRNFIREIHDGFKMTTLFVTHDQEEAMAISDRIAFMDSGILEQLGEPKSFISSPKSTKVAKFFGCKNLFSGEVNDNSFILQDFVLRLGRETTNGIGTLSIRQEDLSIDSSSSSNSFPARIVDWQFAGSRVMVKCEVSTAKARCNLFVEVDRFENLSAGDLIHIKYIPERLHFIASVG